MLSRILRRCLRLEATCADPNAHGAASPSQLPSPKVRAPARIERLDVVVRRRCHQLRMVKVHQTPPDLGGKPAGPRERWCEASEGAWCRSNDPHAKRSAAIRFLQGELIGTSLWAACKHGQPGALWRPTTSSLRGGEGTQERRSPLSIPQGDHRPGYVPSMMCNVALWKARNTSSA